MLIFDKELKALPAAGRRDREPPVLRPPGATSSPKPPLPVPSSGTPKPCPWRPSHRTSSPKLDLGGEGTSLQGKGVRARDRLGRWGRRAGMRGIFAATLRRRGKREEKKKGREGVPSRTPHDVPLWPVNYVEQKAIGKLLPLPGRL